MVQLEYPSGKRSADRERRHLADRKIALNAVEAPSIVRHDGWYYLLTSWDRCCKGVDSTYRIVAGRSRAVTGPYVDQDGRALTEAAARPCWSPPATARAGGESVSGGVVAYHYYDGTADGAPRLGVRKLAWGGDGWPKIPAGDAPGGRPAAP